MLGESLGIIIICDLYNCNNTIVMYTASSVIHIIQCYFVLLLLLSLVKHEFLIALGSYVYVTI